jgi:hypothetical protein
MSAKPQAKRSVPGGSPPDKSLFVSPKHRFSNRFGLPPFRSSNALSLNIVNIHASCGDKSETRNPQSETNSKPQEEKDAKTAASVLIVCPFGFGICFGFRYSDFGFAARPR